MGAPLWLLAVALYLSHELARLNEGLSGSRTLVLWLGLAAIATTRSDPTRLLLLGFVAGGVLAALTRGSERVDELLDQPLQAVVKLEGPFRVQTSIRSARARIEWARPLQSGSRAVLRDRSVRLELSFARGEETAAAPWTRRLLVRGALRARPHYANGVVTPRGPLRLVVNSSRLMEPIDDGRFQALEPQRSSALARRLGELFARPGSNWTSIESGRSQETMGTAEALVLALGLGDRSGLSEELLAQLARSGLLHLIALSGLHVGFALLIVERLLFPLPSSLRGIVALASVALALGVVEVRSSLVRALVMGVTVRTAIVARRRPALVNALGCAWLAAIVMDRESLTELGLELSVAATAGILLLMPRLARFLGAHSPEKARSRWTGSRIAITQLVAATAAAQLATLPFTIGTFGLVPLLGIPANLVFAPLLSIVLPLVWLLVLVAGIGPAPGADELALVLTWILEGLVTPFVWLEQLPATAAIAWPVGRSLAAGALVGVVAAGWPVVVCAVVRGVRGSSTRRVLGRLTLGVLLLVSLMLLSSDRGGRREAQAALTALDVGQGDATLLTRGETAILVDGGGWARGDFARAVLLRALAAEGVRRVDVLIVSHGDADHCRGAAALARYIRIDAVWISASTAESACGAELAERLAGKTVIVASGDRRRVDAFDFDVLWPPRGSTEAGNDGSLVLRARVDGAAVLLTGDIESHTERRLAWEMGDRLRADVLKVAHHGSRSSSTRVFVERVEPRIAVLSAGRRNRYGHPAPEVVDRLRRLGATVLRTDQRGAVKVYLAQPGGRPRRFVTLTSPTGPDSAH